MHVFFLFVLCTPTHLAMSALPLHWCLSGGQRVGLPRGPAVALSQARLQLLSQSLHNTKHCTGMLLASFFSSPLLFFVSFSMFLSCAFAFLACLLVFFILLFSPEFILFVSVFYRFQLTNIPV